MSFTKKIRRYLSLTLITIQLLENLLLPIAYLPEPLVPFRDLVHRVNLVGQSLGKLSKIIAPSLTHACTWVVTDCGSGCADNKDLYSCNRNPANDYVAPGTTGTNTASDAKAAAVAPANIVDQITGQTTGASGSPTADVYNDPYYTATGCDGTAAGATATRSTDNCTYKCEGNGNWSLVSCPSGSVSDYPPTAGLDRPPTGDQTACDINPDSQACVKQQEQEVGKACSNAAYGGEATNTTDKCTYKCTGKDATGVDTWDLVSCPEGQVSIYGPTAGLSAPPPSDKTACDVAPDSGACQQFKTSHPACSPGVEYGDTAVRDTDGCTYICQGAGADWRLESCPAGSVSDYPPTLGWDKPKYATSGGGGGPELPTPLDLSQDKCTKWVCTNPSDTSTCTPAPDTPGFWCPNSKVCLPANTQFTCSEYEFQNAAPVDWNNANEAANDKHNCPEGTQWIEAPAEWGGPGCYTQDVADRLCKPPRVLSDGTCINPPVRQGDTLTPEQLAAEEAAAAQSAASANCTGSTATCSGKPCGTVATDSAPTQGVACEDLHDASCPNTAVCTVVCQSNGLWKTLGCTGTDRFIYHDDGTREYYAPNGNISNLCGDGTCNFGENYTICPHDCKEGVTGGDSTQVTSTGAEDDPNYVELPISGTGLSEFLAAASTICNNDLACMQETTVENQNQPATSLLANAKNQLITQITGCSLADTLLTSCPPYQGHERTDPYKDFSVVQLSQIADYKNLAQNECGRQGENSTPSQITTCVDGWLAQIFAGTVFDPEALAQNTHTLIRSNTIAQILESCPPPNTPHSFIFDAQNHTLGMGFSQDRTRVLGVITPPPPSICSAATLQNLNDQDLEKASIVANICALDENCNHDTLFSNQNQTQLLATYKDLLITSICGTGATCQNQHQNDTIAELEKFKLQQTQANVDAILNVFITALGIGKDGSLSPQEIKAAAFQECLKDVTCQIAYAAAVTGKSEADIKAEITRLGKEAFGLEVTDWQTLQDQGWLNTLFYLVTNPNNQSRQEDIASLRTQLRNNINTYCQLQNAFNFNNTSDRLSLYVRCDIELSQVLKDQGALELQTSINQQIEDLQNQAIEALTADQYAADLLSCETSHRPESCVAQANRDHQKTLTDLQAYPLENLLEVYLSYTQNRAEAVSFLSLNGFLDQAREDCRKAGSACDPDNVHDVFAHAQDLFQKTLIPPPSPPSTALETLCNAAESIVAYRTADNGWNNPKLNCGAWGCNTTTNTCNSPLSSPSGLPPGMVTNHSFGGYSCFLSSSTNSEGQIIETVDPRSEARSCANAIALSLANTADNSSLPAQAVSSYCQTHTCINNQLPQTLSDQDYQDFVTLSRYLATFSPEDSQNAENVIQTQIETTFKTGSQKEIRDLGQRLGFTDDELNLVLRELRTGGTHSSDYNRIISQGAHRQLLLTLNEDSQQIFSLTTANTPEYITQRFTNQSLWAGWQAYRNAYGQDISFEEYQIEINSRAAQASIDPQYVINLDARTWAKNVCLSTSTTYVNLDSSLAPPACRSLCEDIDHQQCNQINTISSQTFAAGLNELRCGDPTSPSLTGALDLNLSCDTGAQWALTQLGTVNTLTQYGFTPNAAANTVAFGSDLKSIKDQVDAFAGPVVSGLVDFGTTTYAAALPAGFFEVIGQIDNHPGIGGAWAAAVSVGYSHGQTLAGENLFPFQMSLVPGLIVVPTCVNPSCIAESLAAISDSVGLTSTARHDVQAFAQGQTKGISPLSRYVLPAADTLAIFAGVFNQSFSTAPYVNPRAQEQMARQQAVNQIEQLGLTTPEGAPLSAANYDQWAPEQQEALQIIADKYLETLPSQEEANRQTALSNLMGFGFLGMGTILRGTNTALLGGVKTAVNAGRISETTGKLIASVGQGVISSAPLVLIGYNAVSEGITQINELKTSHAAVITEIDQNITDPQLKAQLLAGLQAQNAQIEQRAMEDFAFTLIQQVAFVGRHIYTTATNAANQARYQKLVEEGEFAPVRDAAERANSPEITPELIKDAYDRAKIDTEGSTDPLAWRTRAAEILADQLGLPREVVRNGRIQIPEGTALHYEVDGQRGRTLAESGYNLFFLEISGDPGSPLINLRIQSPQGITRALVPLDVSAPIILATADTVSSLYQNTTLADWQSRQTQTQTTTSTKAIDFARLTQNLVVLKEGATVQFSSQGVDYAFSGQSWRNLEIDIVDAQGNLLRTLKIKGSIDASLSELNLIETTGNQLRLSFANGEITFTDPALTREFVAQLQGPTAVTLSVADPAVANNPGYGLTLPEKIGFNLLRVVSGIVNAPNTLAHSIADSLTTIELAFARENGFFGFVRNRLAGRPAPETALQPLPAGIQQHAQDAADVMAKIATAKSGGAKTPEQIRDQAQPGDMVIIKLEYAGEASTRELPATAGQETSPKVVYEVIQLVPGDPAKNVAETTPTSTETALADALAVERPTTYTLYLYKASDAAMSRQADVALQLALSRIETMSPEETLNFLKTIPLALRTFYVPEPGTRELPGGTIPTDPSQLALLPTARTFTYPGQTQAPMYEPAADGSITIAPNATILTPSPVIIPPGTTHIQIDSNTYLLSQQPIKPGTPFSVGTLSIFGYIPQIFFPDGIPSGSLSSASGPQPNPAISPTQITILGFLSFSLPLPEIFFKFLNGLGNRLAGTPTQIPLAAAPAAPITQEIPPPPAVPEIPTVPPTTPAETTQAPQKTAVKIPVPAKESPSTVAQTISSIVAATQERAQTEVVASVPSVSPEINDAIAQATGNLTPDQVNANKELARALFFYVTVDNALRRAQTAAKSFSDKIEDGQVALLNPDALAEEFIRQAPISLIGNWRGTVQRSAASYTVDTADREQATAVYEQTLNRQISLIAEAQKQSFFEIASERQQAVNNLTQTIKRVVNLLPTISQGIDPQSETASIIRSIAGALDEKFIGTDPTQENLTRALSIIEQGAADIASLTQGKTASEINEIYQNEQLQADIADLTIIASLQPQPPATPIFPTLLPAGSQPTIARLPAPPPLVSQITELGQLIPSGPVIALPAALVIDIATTTEIGQIITNALRSNPLIANLLPPLPTQQEVETLSPEEIDNAVSAVVEADLALRKQARQEELTAALRSRQQTVVEQQETAAVAAERQARIRALIDQNQQILEAEADTTPEEKAATRQAAIDSYLAQTPTAEITSYFASTKEASDYYHQLFAQLETEITARQAQVEAARQAQLDALARGRTTQARQRAALATLYVGIEAAFGRLTASVLENALEYQQLQAQQAATLDAMAAALALQQARAATIAAFQIAQEELETVLTDNRLSTAQTTAILNRSVSGQNATVEQLLSLTAINLDNFDPETIDGLTIALSDITERVTTAAAAAAFLAETLPFTPTPSLPNRLTPEIAQAIAEKALATTTPQRRGYLTKLRQDITSRTEATLEAEAEIARRQATAAFLAEAGSVVITPLSPALSRVTLATALNIAEGLLRLRSPERAQELADLRAAIETRNSEAIPLPAPKQPTLFPTPTLPKLPTAKQPAIPLPAPAVEERTRQAEAEAALPAAPEELPIPQIQTPSEKIAQAVINLFTTPINPIPTTIFRNTVRHNFTKLFTDELQLLTQEQVEQQVNRSVLLGPLRYFILDTTESISVSLDYIIHPTPQISRIKGIINLLMLPLTTVINPVGGFASETANYAVTPILTPTNLIGLALSVYGLAYPLPQFAADPPLYLTLFFIMRILIPLPTIYFLHVPPISLITFWFRAIHETTHRLNQGILPVNPAIFPTYKLGNEAITDYFALRSTDNPSNLLEKISRAITIAGMYIYSRYNHYTNIQTLIELLAQKSGLTFTQVEKLLATSYLSIPGSENSFNDFITNLLGPDTATQLLDVINEQVGSSTASKLMEELILAPTEEQTPATPAPPDTEAVPTTIEEPTLPPAPTLPKVAIPTTTEPPSPEITATRLNLALSLLTGIPSFLTDIFSTTLSALAARIPQRINLSPLQEQITKITSATSQTLSSLPFPKLILPLALSLVIFTNTSFTSFVPPSQISEALAPPAPPAITQTIPTQPEFIQPQAPSSIETPPAAITTPPAPATQPAPFTQTDPGKTVIVSDSQGSGTPLPSILLAELQRAGIPFQFVGSRVNTVNPQNSPIPIEAHGGFTITKWAEDFLNKDGDNMWNNSQTSGGRIPDNPPIDYTLPENRPDLVLYEIGTNDALGFENLAAANSEISLRKTIDKWIAINPNIRIILFPVSPVSPNLLEVNTRIAALNEIFKRVATDYPQVTYAGDLAPWNPVSQTFTGWGSEQTLWSDRVPENPAEPYLGVHLNQESAQRVVNNALPTILDTIEDIQTTIPAPQPPTPELKIVVATTQIPPQYQVGNPAFVSLSNPKLQFIPLDASDFTLPNPNNQSPENISAVVSYLNPLKSSRYQANDEGTQCNTFVIDAFFLLNTPIPRWFNGIEMSAQRILGWLTNTEAGGGYSIGWREVSAQEAQNLANQGYSVVASTPIHIAVVIPGEGSSTNDVFYPTVAQNGSNNTSAYNPSFNYQNPRYFAYKDQNNYKFTQTSTLITIADNSIATIYAYSSSKQTPSNPANLTSPLNETVIPVTTQTYIYGSHLGWDLAFLHYAPDGSINIPITLPENATLVADFTLNPNNPLAEIIDMSGHIRWYLVDVQMPDGQVKPYIFSYGHLQENALLVGNTGESQGPHLHFSVIDVDQLLQTTNQTDVIEAIKLTLTGQANDQIQANRNNILINPATIIPALENLPFQSPQAQSFFGTGLLGTIGGIINTALLSRLDPQSPIAKVINSIFSRLFPRRTTTTTPSTTTKEAQKTSEPPSQLAERAREANRRFYAQKQREFDRQQLINSITQPLRNIGTFLSHLSQTLNDTILKPLGIDFNAYLTIMAPFTERLSLLPSSFLPPTQSSVTLNLQDPELLAKQLSELNVPPGSIPAVVTVEGSTPTELTIYPSELPTDLPAATNVYPMSFEMRGIQTNPSPASTLLAQIHEALLAAPAPAILQPQTTAELEAYYLSLLAPFTDLPKDRFDDIPPRGSVIIPSEVTEVTHISRPSTTAVSTFNPADHPVFEANIPVPKSLDFSSALTSTARRLAENNITDVSSISWRDIDTQAIAEELIPELTTTHGNGVIAKKLLRDFYAAKITLEGIDTTYMPTYYFSQLLPDLQTDEPKLYELFRNALFYFLAQNFKHQDTLIKTSENLSKTVNSYTQNLIYTAQSLQQENITNVNIWAESLAAISHPPDHPRYPEAVANWKKLLLSYGSTPEKWFSDDRQSPNYNLGVRQVAESIQDGKNGFNYTFSLATVKMAESLYPQSVPSQPPSENITSQFPSTLTAVGVGLGLTGALTAVLGPEVATVILPVIGLSALAYAGLTQTSLGQTLQTQIPVLGNIPKFIKQIGQTISNVIPAPLRGFIPLGLSIPTQRFDRTNQTSIQFDPGQSYRSRLAQYVTGFPIEQPQALTDTIIADRTALLAEYSLPPTIDDPSIYQHNLLDFATTYNIPIKLYTEVPSQFQDQIPPLGHAFYDDLWGTKTVYVQSLNTLDPQELTYLAHELIHGTDDRLNSWLPPEFQEYRAYLSQPDLPSTLIGQSEKINPSNLHKFFNLVAASALADLREQLQVSGQDPNSLVTPWDENGPLSSPLSDIAIAARQTLAGNIPTHTPSLPQPLSGSEPENNPPPQGSIPSTLSALAPIGIGIALSPLLGPLVLPAVAIGAIASRFLTPRIFNTPIGKKLQSFFAPVNQFLNRRQIAVTTIAATLVGMPVLTNLTPSLDWLSQPETPTNYQQLFVESATHQAAQQYVANLSDTLINSSNHTLANADPHNIFTPWLIAEYKKYLDPTTKATITDDAVITAINQHSSSYGKLVEFWWRNYQDDLIKQFTTHAPRITDPNGNNFLEGYRISRGGTSDVFQTIDMQTGQIVVAKQFRSDNQGILKPRDLEIEYKRMQNAQRIIGNQTVQPLSFIPNSGNPIIIMESLNSTLDRYLQQYQITHGSPLPIDIVLQIGEQLADIIDKLHNDPTEKLFHGDLKPKNIFIFEENGQIRLKLGDYGVDSSEDGSMVLFTPHYIHPDKSYLINTEIGSVADNIKRQNADIYAYAVILFELLFEGYHPFIKGHPVEIAQKTPHDIMQIYNDPSEIYTFLELRQDNIPLDRFSQKTVNALNALYKKIYQDDPQKLPVNCKSFFNMFQSALTGTVPATGPLPPLP